MRRLLALAFCLGLANAAGAQVLSEDFDSGTWPPAGWTVVDNTGNGSWELNTYFGRPNYTPGGTGDCAAIDSDWYGSVDVDGELWTVPFDLPATAVTLEFDMDYQNFAGYDYADVDISLDSGATWTNLVSYNADLTQHSSVDLGAYANNTGVILRFHYYIANYYWWWQIDNVVIDTAPCPEYPIWIEDFDGGTWPPAGWTVVDNLGNGTWDTSSMFSHGNLAGTGECAAIDSDNYGSVDVDGELIYGFDVPAYGTVLKFNHYFRTYTGADFADVDISTDGGTTWTNVLSYFGGTFSGQVALDMTAYAGLSVQIRWHYYNANWEWYWHVDDVALYVLASATSRNAGTNPDSYTVTQPPIVGGPFAAEVDLAGTTGHNLALIAGYFGSLTLTLGGGQTLLIDITDPAGEVMGQPPTAGPIAYFNCDLPCDPGLPGIMVYSQAVHIGGAPFVLSNAQDLVVGY